MKYWLKQMGFSSKGLRNEMAIAFGLVLLAFLVFMGYLFPGISSIFQIKTNLGVVVIVVFFVLFLGFIAVAQMIEPVIRIASEAKKIADGDYDRDVKLARNDEIGELGDALTRMSHRLKKNLEELRVFSAKTESINIEINKRILTLSSLIQLGDLVSQNASLDEIINIGVEKCLSSECMTLSCLILREKQSDNFYIRSLHGPDSRNIDRREKFAIKHDGGLLGKVLLKRDTTIVDKNIKPTRDVKEFQELFSITNAVIAPIISKGKTYGFLIAGNNKTNFAFPSIDCEFNELISKHLSIAIENDLLSSKLQKLEVIDHLTGLFNKSYMIERLDEEIKRAIRFHRPCAFVVFVIDRFKEYHEAFGHLAAENILIKIGNRLKENLSEVDKVGRFGDHDFAVILPEKNKPQSIEIAENIRNKIELTFSEEEDALKKLTCTGTIAENPLDGMTADDLIAKTTQLLQLAKSEGGNKIYHKT